MLSWLCSGISGSQLWMIIQLWNNFSIQHLQWVPWKPCHDVGTAGIFRQSLLRMMPNFAQVTEVRDEQERIASLLVAILVVGIGAGSFLSYPIVNCLWYDHLGPTHCWEQSWILYFQYQTLSLCDQGLWSVVFSNESPKSPTQFLLCRMRCFACYCLELNSMKKCPFNIMIRIDHDKNMLHLHYTREYTYRTIVHMLYIFISYKSRIYTVV